MNVPVFDRKPRPQPYRLLALASSLIVAVVCLGSIDSPADAATPLGGLAVAANPAGTQLVAAGDNRVFYDIDPKTLAVKRRVPYGRPVVSMTFSSDGTRLLVESTNAVAVVDPATLKATRTIERADYLTVATGVGLAAYRSKKNPASIHVMRLDNGKDLAAIPYDPKTGLSALGLSSDGKRLLVFGAGKTDKDEKKTPRKDMPKDLKGTKRKIYYQKNDGRMASIRIVDVTTGKDVLAKKSWLCPSGSALVTWNGDDALVTSYGNDNARVTKDGTVHFLPLETSINYGMGHNNSNDTLLLGGLRSGARISIPSLKTIEFKIDEIPGFPEYWRSFTFDNKGMGYGTTSAYRIAQIDANGKIERVAFVH